MSISYKTEFLENKSKIISCLDNAMAFMDEFGYNDRKNAIIKQKNDLENGEFTIVVVGEFSAGKSTFLNALMGKKILPSFTSETTATINFLRHKNCAKNGEEGCVYFSDENTISKYVSTRGDDVANTVHHLDLYMDSKFLEDNVTLVDSPGLNGVAKGHTELTKEQIQKSSASIFMFSARQPGSKTDFEVLADLSKRVSSIICVLNQIDAIKTSEGETVESVIKKLKQNYKEVMGDDVTSIPEIYPVSAYQALVGRDSNCTVQNGIGETITLTDEERKKYEDSSRIKEFEERLFRYLTQGEKAKASMSTPVSQLCQILKEIQGELEEEIQLLDGTIDETELENQIEALQEKKKQLETEIKEKHTEVKKSLQENKEEIIDRIKAEAEHLRTKLIRQLDNWEEIEDIEPENILRILQKGVKTIAEEAEDEFVINNGRITDEYTDGLIDTTISAEFKFKVSGELPPVETVSVGIEEFQAEIRKLEAKEEELKKVLDDTTINMIERLETQQKRECLEREIVDKKSALEIYEETSQSAMPSIRTYTDRVEKARTIKKRKIFSDKVVYEWVDVTKTDSTERDEFKKERNERINKKQKEIERLEEELRNIPTGNVVILEKKQKELDQAIAEIKQTKIDLNNEFRKKAEDKIKSTIKKNKYMIEDYIDEKIDAIKTSFAKQYEKSETALIKLITDHISASVKQKIEKAEARIIQMKNEMSQAESDKLEKSTALNNQLSKVNALIDEIFELYDIIDAIPTDVIESIDLED